MSSYFSKSIKGLVAFLLAVFILVSMCGCDEAKSKKQEAKNEATPTAEAQSTKQEAQSEATPTVTEEPAETEKPENRRTEEPIETEEPKNRKTEEYSGVVFSKIFLNSAKKDAVTQYGFIELYNCSENDIDLSGLSIYFKSKLEPDYKEYKFENTTIKARDYYLVTCTGPAKYETENEIIHLEKSDCTWETNFGNEEVSILLALSGRTLDNTVEVAEISNKISYFCCTENYYFDTGYVDEMSKSKYAVRVELTKDSGYHVINLTKANSTTLNQIVPNCSTGVAGSVTQCALNEVKFSRDPGFYEESFNLSLSAASGYKIYYTTDGSDPKTSRTRRSYINAINLSDTSSVSIGATTTYAVKKVGSNVKPSVSNLPGAHVIKAFATDGTTDTEVYTASYFISKLFAGYNVSVMSISLDKEVLCGSDGFYNHYSPSSNDPNTRGLGMLEVFDENGTRRGYSNVEMSVSGHGSSGYGMKSLKIYYSKSNNLDGGMDSKLYYDIFDGYATNSKGQTITDYSRLLIRNSGNDCPYTLIRDSLLQRLSRELSVDSMAYAPALVFINGEFWGLYNVRERYSGEYVESHYGVDADNVAIIESDYSQVHTNLNADFVLTSGLETDPDDFNQLVRYMKSNNLSKTTNYNYVESRIDIDSFIDMYIARLYFSARDWPENNIKVWKNRAGKNDPSGVDSKWHFTLLDTDFGLDFPGVDTGSSSNYFGWIDSTACVVSNMMHALIKNETFKQKFLSRFSEVVATIYVPSEMEAELDKIVEQRASVFQLQVDRWGSTGISTSNYTSGVSSIRSFLQNRNKYVLKYLASYFGVTENYIKNLGGTFVNVSFSETRVTIKVNGTSISSDWMEEFNGEGSYKIDATAKEGFTVTKITFTDYNGNVVSKDGPSAEFTITKSGTFSIETKKNSTETKTTVQSGIVCSGYTIYYLDPEGNLYGWGSNVNNILCVGTSTENVLRPTFITDNVVKVETVHSNDCENSNNAVVVTAILKNDGEVYTIGANTGSLGRTGNATEWGVVGFDGIAIDISVGYDHLLILDKDGVLWGIGNNSYGQLGKAGEGSSVSAFQKIATNVAQISAGRRNTAYIDNNGDCYILGDGRWNKFNDQTSNITTPWKLLSNATYVSSGEHELVIVDESGALYYAGWRDVSSFTQGTGTHGAIMIKSSGVAKAAIHFGDIAILGEDGSAYVFGINNGGAIGTATTGTAAKVIENNCVDVGAGYAFTAFLMNDGSVKVMGDNSCGQSGNGNKNEHSEFSEILLI